MAWQKEKVDYLLVLEENRKQGCFDGFKGKQVKMMLGNDESLRKMSLMMLGSSHDSNCHLSCLEKTGSEDEVPAKISYLEPAHNDDG